VIFFFAAAFIICLLLLISKPNNFKNIVFEFNHWGMTKRGTNTEFTRPWRGFEKLKETKSFIFLYISENDAHTIQKRMFSSTDEMNAFLKFADQNIWSNHG
jgi:hypothetical protein